MADVKISALSALTTPDPADVLPIVDVAPTPTTKQITVANLLAGAPGAGGTAWVGLTDGPVITSDAAFNGKARFFVTLAGNRTLAAPLNPVDGTLATFRLKQDGAGSRTITLQSGAGGFITPTDIVVTLSAGANLTDLLSAIYIQAANAWVVLALTKGASIP